MPPAGERPGPGLACRCSDGSTGSEHSPISSESTLCALRTPASESTLYLDNPRHSESERTRGLTVRAYAEDLPTQADAVTGGVATADAPAPKMLPDLDYLQVSTSYYSAASYSTDHYKHACKYAGRPRHAKLAALHFVELSAPPL